MTAPFLARGYMLQYSAVDAERIARLAPSLFITEGAPLGGAPAIADAEVDDLVARGTAVLGYVNVAVTDDTRPWWNPAWTDDGTDSGMPTGSAPAWLAGQPLNEFGHVVDFTDPDWATIVIDQAVDLVSRGYSGVFLDDVAQYFVSGATGLSIAEQAAAMMELVSNVAAAIRRVNADAIVIVNATPYIVTDAVGGQSSQASRDFLGAVDAMLLESYFGINRAKESQAIAHARNVILPSIDVLALEFGGNLEEAVGFFRASLAAGFSAFNSLDAGYDTPGRHFAAGAVGADILAGSAISDVLFGEAGADRLFGANGRDWLEGGQGADRLAGGSGADSLIGGQGDDHLAGGSGRAADHFVFAGVSFGRDVIADFDPGRDRIEVGNAANRFSDLVIRQSGDDVLVTFRQHDGLSIRLTDTLAADIARDDFLFA